MVIHAARDAVARGIRRIGDLIATSDATLHTPPRSNVSIPVQIDHTCVAERVYYHTVHPNPIWCDHDEQRDD